MFCTCFTLAQINNNYFKNKTLQIVQFQFFTVHFLLQPKQDFGETVGTPKSHFQKTSLITCLAFLKILMKR